MSRMAEFVEDLIENHEDVLDGLPDDCTSGLVSSRIWRSECTLATRGNLFVIVRFELVDVGSDCFKAQFSLRQWHPDNGVVATEFLPVGPMEPMTDTLAKKLAYWKVKPEVAEGEQAQRFLQFVCKMNATLSERFELDPEAPFI